MAPNKENIQKWVDELESDRWVQIYGKAYGDKKNEACAVGVAYDVHDNETGKIKDYIGSWKFYGVDIPSAKVKYKDSLYFIADLNDRVKLSFKEIAQCIKDTYL